jgi:hypothetical protein
MHIGDDKCIQTSGQKTSTEKRDRCRWEDNVKIGLCEVNSIQLAQDRVQWWADMKMVMNLHVQQKWKISNITVNKISCHPLATEATDLSLYQW